MQNLLQDSLPLTPRPPIDGKPGECKQEVADSIVMAGHTNRMVRMAEPQIVDIDQTAMLGGEPVAEAYIVDDGA